ncbi:MAG: hypothetical protein HOM96_02385 [Rickettsiales bacterium]|jgi:type IV secretory pathway component VirB8|nr:hypothetical protein [Rickettsiales bacterium]
MKKYLKELSYQNSIADTYRWQLFCLMQIGIIGILVIAIMLMMPLKEKEVQYVAFSKADDIVFSVIETPLKKNQKLLLLRQALRNYVYNRHTFYNDKSLEYPRFKKVVAMSTDSITREFKVEYERILKESSFNKREIQIIRDIPIGTGSHQIEFKTVDTYQGKEYENFWVVNIVYEFKKFRVRADNELLNPLGIVVTNYLQAKKNLKQEELNEIFK